MEQKLFDNWTHDGEQKLAFFTGVPGKHFYNTDFVALKQDLGYYLDGQGELVTWSIEGVGEEEGKLLFYGPHLEIEAIGRDFTPTAEEMKTLTIFFNQLEDHREVRFTPLHFARIKAGGFILFPPLVIEEIIKMSSLGLFEDISPYAHPDLRGSRGLSYTLAVLDFRRLYGFHPWSQNTEESLAHEIRSRVIPSLSDHCSNSMEGDIISRSLGGDPPPLDDWTALKFSPEEKPSESFLDIWEQSSKRFNTKRYLMRNRIKILLVTAGTAILLALTSFGVKKALEPPFTLGMSTYEVVEGYYNALEELDATKSAEYLLRTGKSDPQKAMDMIYTFNAMRVHKAGGEESMTPEEWLDLGGPTLLPTQAVLGYTDLEITKLEEDLYEVNYFSWYPADEDSPPGMPQILKIKDLVTLTEKKDAWFIYSVETVENSSMEYQ